MSPRPNRSAESLRALAALLALALTAPSFAGKPGGGGTTPPPNLPVNYRLLQLGTLGDSSHAYALSDGGTVVGQYTSTGVNYAFRVLPTGPMEDLNEAAAEFDWIDADAPDLPSDAVRPGWRLTSGHGVNRSGMITGMCVPAGQTDDAIIRSYRFDPGTRSVVLLPTTGAAWTRTGWYKHVNEQGDVAYTDQGVGRVLVYTGPYDGGDRLLFPLNGAFVSAIGDGGTLAGGFYTSTGRLGDGYVYVPGSGLLTAPFVGFFNLNMSPDARYVVCDKNLTVKGKAVTYGHRYTTGAAAPVSITPAGGLAEAVNSSGDVCGTYNTSSGGEAPYLYLNGDGMSYGLVDLAQQSGLPATFASLAITSREPTTGFPWMCGESPDASGASRAVLVYPVLK